MIDTMIITFFGGQFFKFQHGDTVIAIDPPSKESKLKSARFGANVVLQSIADKDMNGSDTLGSGDKQPFLIDSPGEYETKGIFVSGFQSTSNFGGKERFNTIYKFGLDSIDVCFLGAHDGELSKDIVEALGNIDVLLVPIGGDGVLAPSDAYKICLALSPKLVIPMHYGEMGSTDALKKFIKEGGAENPKPQDKLTIKRKDLDGKEADIVVLEY